MTAGENPRYPEGAPGYGSFSEDAAVEGPAIELFQSLGWDHANLYQEFGGESPEGRRNDAGGSAAQPTLGGASKD